MKRIFLSFLLALLFSVQVGGQAIQYIETPVFLKANSYWTLSNRIGLHFDGDDMTPLVDTPFYGVLEGGAAISHPLSGKMLFYTADSIIRNGQHQVMLNGRGLVGSTSSTLNGACIVPFPGDTNKYYIFNLTQTENNKDSNRLYYHVVDMSLDNGRGAVTEKNKTLLPFLTGEKTYLAESVIAIAGNNCDVWLVLHGARLANVTRDWQNSNTYYVFHITEAGISGPQKYQGDHVCDYVPSQLKVNPKRDMLVFYPFNFPGNPGRAVELARFDATTGTISHPMKIEIPNNLYPSGLTAFTHDFEFSPDGQYLYAQCLGLPIGGDSLFRFSMAYYHQDSIRRSRINIGYPAGPFSLWGTLKLYNNVIYNSRYTRYKLGAILNPNSASASGVILRDSVVQLNTMGSIPNFSNYVAYPFTEISRLILDTAAICVAGERPLTLYPGSRGAAGYLWDDGSTDTLRSISDTGTYWVCYSYLSKTNCLTIVTDTLIVRNRTVLQPVIQVEGNASNRLIVSDVYAGYQWYFNGVAIEGADKWYIDIVENGMYSVEVTDTFGCRSLSEAYKVSNLSDDIELIALSHHVTIFPNPTGAFLFVRAGKYLGDLHFRVLSVLGKECYARQISLGAGDIHTIETGSLARGLYFLEVTNNRGMRVAYTFSRQ